MHDLEQTDMLQPLVNEIETTVSNVEYATYGMDSNLFVSKYELYLPDRKELEKLVNNILEQDSRQEKKTDN
ncbi:hypothetical protein [Eisenbergiella sp.]